MAMCLTTGRALSLKPRHARSPRICAESTIDGPVGRVQSAPRRQVVSRRRRRCSLHHLGRSSSTLTSGVSLSDRTGIGTGTCSDCSDCFTAVQYDRKRAGFASASFPP